MIFKKAGPIDFLVVGLGNYGKQYENTRHNAGFRALNALADDLGADVKRARFSALCGEGNIGDKRVLLMLPQTYMNNSGEAVAAAMKFYKLEPSQLLVFSDDVSLPLGTVRVRRKGSDGGQKGLRSIITYLGTEDFVRIKLGVGEKPHPQMELADWVLSRFTKAEGETMDTAAKTAAEAAKLAITDSVDAAMNRYSK
ncbi:MAG: aminoacyl-tRNA hydrolase [Clostridia bacterium]|nr:aminoacyl-tRNA hydrolase [Clostridia bacterium]